MNSQCYSSELICVIPDHGTAYTMCEKTSTYIQRFDHLNEGTAVLDNSPFYLTPYSTSWQYIVYSFPPLNM